MPRGDRVLTKPGSSTERVIADVLGRIATGALGPGEQLRQEEFSDLLGVSRVPVREALYALAEQGVLVHRKHRGFFVTKRNAAELAQIARLLELISTEVLASIDWPDEAHLQHLRTLNARMAALADAGDLVETQQLNTEFHLQIFRLSPKRIMIAELERLWRLAHPYIITEMATPEARRRRLAEHAEIIARLEAHDRQGLLDWHDAHRRRAGDLAEETNAELRGSSPHAPETQVPDAAPVRLHSMDGPGPRSPARPPAVLFRSAETG